MRLPREIEFERANAAREQILQLCDTKPMRRSELREITGLGEKKMANYLGFLSDRIKLVHFGMGANSRWMTVRLFQKLHPNRPVPTLREEHATPVVRGVSFAADWKPEVTVETTGGVEIKRYSGPPDRWASDIKPGHGAISGDWMLRRQGVQIETRVRAYA